MAHKNNFSLRRKLILVSLMLLAGFLVIIFTMNRSIKINKQIASHTAALTKFQLLAKEANNLLSSGQRLVAEFQTSKDINLVKRHNGLITRLDDIIDKLISHVVTVKDKKILEGLKKTLKDYQNAFKRKVVAIVEIGLDEKSGLIGNVNQAAFEIEKEVRAIGNVNLINSILEKRRLERNFLLYSRKKDLAKLVKLIDKFSLQIETGNIHPRTRKNILYSLKKNKNSLIKIRFAIDDMSDDSRLLDRTTKVMDTSFDQIRTRGEEYFAENNRTALARIDNINRISMVILASVSILVTLLFLNLTRTLTRSLRRLTDTVHRLSQGNYEARTMMKPTNELGELGFSFDKMLDERVTNMAKAEHENEQLNESIMVLLEAVSILSEKDLTITVPISENITGAVGDAINLLATETARVLNDIKLVAEKVDETASSVRNQSDKVSGVAESERKVLEHTVAKLESAAKKMNSIANHSQQCNSIASEASDTTNTALNSVNDTVMGMAEIRETISETEKRIKRLGERSQEITKIVEIINNIAERTNVLALNASMQASAAGEAGRGFAVIAEEIRRLAENSQGETAQISELVGSIQMETSSTMVAMNKAIDQVVRGSELAEAAGKQMLEAQNTTAKLVAAVAEIAKESIHQAKMNVEIGQSAILVQKSTLGTREELNVQAEQTKNLVIYAENMLKQVSQFKLPGV